ncbi:MAG: hypothetical protein R2747_23110 [Pyrinomonadaceae bacterium]
MKVEKIWEADVYRDGGSYGFCFDSDDGNWYEFFIQTKAFEQSASDDDYYPPVIYLEGCNSKKVVKEFSWREAQKYVASLKYDNQRFRELVEIVNNNGKRA